MNWRNFKYNINTIKSAPIRAMAQYFMNKDIEITCFGQVWSEQEGDWIYFDTILDLDQLKKDFNLGDNLIIHENLDPKSGTERGYIDEETGEGIMGRIS